MPDDHVGLPEADLKRGINERARRFEEEVADLFRLLGYKATVDVKDDDTQIDVVIEKSDGIFTTRALVECKDWTNPVDQNEVRYFGIRVEEARRVNRFSQAILVARSGFRSNCHAVAQKFDATLLTFKDLLRKLFDLGPHVEDAVRSFEGSVLQRLYVEQDVVLQSDLQPGEVVTPKPLTATVREWIAKDDGTLLTLLGDFGSGKTSFCRCLAHELARDVRADPEGAKRSPLFVDLREGGSTTVTLENLLIHRCQQLTSEPVRVPALLRLNSEGYLVLIFDGFDEILGYSEPARFLDNLRQILRAAVGKAKVILTCRTHYFRDRPEEVQAIGRVSKVLSSTGATQLYEAISGRPGAEIAYLREFTPAQVDAYLEKAVPKGTDWKGFRDEIRRVYNLEDLAKRPFLLEIIVKSLPSLKPRADGSSVTVTDLYEAYCAKWFDQNVTRLALTRDFKERLVEYLACRLWNEPEQSVHHSRLTDAAVAFFEDRQLTPLEKEQVDYEVRTALFLHRDADGNYRFIHRSFLEFFVARTLRAGLANGDRACLDLRPLTREAVFFLEQWPEGEKIPELARQVLGDPYARRVSENALRLLYFHVRTRVAGPLVGPDAEEQDADDVLAGIAERFGKLRPEAIDLAGADLGGAMLRGADLAGARLAGATLAGADLRGAVADGADLDGASLVFADLRRARLAGTRLAGAVLDHADARGAGLRGAVLDRADLTFARFTGAELAEASMADARTVGTAFGIDAAARPGCVPQVGHAFWVRSVAWRPDGKVVASGGADGTVRLWDPADGRLLAVLEGHRGSVLSVAWDPAGERLASGSDDQTVKIWDPRSGRVDKNLEGHTQSVGSVAWDPAGERLASGSDDQTVKIWDPRSGRVAKNLEGHTQRVLSVAWDPAGERLASGSDDQTVKIWNPRSGRVAKNLEGHTQSVWSVAWDPAGERLASGSWDCTVRIWEAASGHLLATLPVLDGARGLAWTAAGRLAVATFSGIVEIWDVSAEPRRLARLYEAPPVTGLVVTEDGYVDGPPAALRNVRFADGWALYDLDDLPERHAPERVRAALARPAS